MDDSVKQKINPEFRDHALGSGRAIKCLSVLFLL